MHRRAREHSHRVPHNPRTLKMMPAMVVPVFVKPGPCMPRFCSSSLRSTRSKLKPPVADAMALLVVCWVPPSKAWRCLRQFFS